MEDGQHVITFSYGNEATRVYTPDGTEIASLSGTFREFISSQEAIIVSSHDEGTAGLYTLDGAELAAYNGQFTEFWPECEIVATYRNQEQTSFLYSLEGEELAVIPDFLLRRRSPNGEMIAIDSYAASQTDLYRINGCD